MTVDEKRTAQINKIFELLECLRSGDLTKMATAKDMIKKIIDDFN